MKSEIDLPTLNTEEIPLDAHLMSNTVPQPAESSVPPQKPLSITTVLFTQLEHLREAIEVNTRRMNYLDISVSSVLGRSEERQAASNHLFTIAFCFIGAFMLVVAFLLGVMVR